MNTTVRRRLREERERLGYNDTSAEAEDAAPAAKPTEQSGQQAEPAFNPPAASFMPAHAAVAPKPAPEALAPAPALELMVLARAANKVTEDAGSVVLEFADVVITIKRKPPQRGR